MESIATEAIDQVWLSVANDPDPRLQQQILLSSLQAVQDRSIKERINYGFILLDKPAGIRSKTAAYIAKNIG